MSTPPIPPPPLDTIVYSRDGRRAKYVCSIVGPRYSEHFVKPEVEISDGDGDYQSSFEGATIWHEFFLTPPREVIDKEIAELSAKAEELRAEVYKLGRDKAEAERDITARKARLVQHAQLKHLDDFITKGVACYAVDSDYGRVDIVDLKDTKSDNGWRDEFKLLSLYGKSDGQLNWKLHQYSDGSGNSKNECIPCASRNDALAAVAELLDRRWAEWRKDGKLYGLANYAESAAKHGIPVPADVATQIAQDVEKAKVTQLEFAKAELVKAQENLARLEAGLAPTGAAKPWAK